MLKPGFRLKKYFQLAALIFRYGSLNRRGQNFNLIRVKSLQNLQEFVPRKPGSKTLSAPKEPVNSLIAQAAFVRSAFNVRGGHLCVPGLCYIRIPKAANTSIGHEMLLKKYPGLKDVPLDETQINFLSDVNLRELNEAGTEIFFTVVRNPFARLVSVYRDFFETDHGSFIYQDYLFGILDQKITFAEFVDRVSRIPDRLKDQHLKPQHLFIEPYDRRTIRIQVFKLEEPGSLKSFLNEQGLELSHRNKSRQPYDYAQYYDAVLTQKVYKIYQRDIETFGYHEVYESLSGK